MAGFTPSVFALQKAGWEEEPRDEGGEWTSGNGTTPGALRKVAPLPLGKPRIHPGAILPRTGFDGVRGHSNWTSDDPTLRALTGGRAVTFKNGFPRFEPFVPRINGLKASAKIVFTGDRDRDFAAGDRALAQRLGWISKSGRLDAARVKRLRQMKRWTWHHDERCEKSVMILVPTDLHAAVRHTGGFSLCSPS